MQNPKVQYELIARRVLEAAGSLSADDIAFNEVIIEQFIEQMVFRIGADMLNELEEYHLADYQQAELSEQPNALNEFLKKHIPHHEDVIEQSIAEFCEEYLQFSENILQ